VPLARAVQETPPVALASAVRPTPQRVWTDHRLASLEAESAPAPCPRLPVTPVAAGSGEPGRYPGSVKDEAVAKARPRGTAEATEVLIFDGECGFCTWAARWAERRLPPGTGILPYQRVPDPSAYGLTDEEIAGAAYWIDARGRPRRGHLAAAGMFRAIGGAWATIGSLIREPPISWLAAGIYEMVSRNRHRLPGSVPACRDDGSER
jgi:predicted DCC family thiol-disulfide oxidoreductase YuxK